MQRVVRSVVVCAVSALALTSCGGSSDPQAAPTETASPTTATPTPSVTPQAVGPGGVQTRIVNWDKYADNESVVGFADAYAAVIVSTNAHRATPEYTQLMTKPQFRRMANALSAATSGNWHVDKVAKFRVQSTSGGPNKQTLRICVWHPSIGYRKADNEFASDVKPRWLGKKITMNRVAGVWKLAGIDTAPDCTGKAPA